MEDADATILRVADLKSRGMGRREVANQVRTLERLAVGAYADTTGRSSQQVHLLRARSLVDRVGSTVASHMPAGLDP